MEIWISQQLQLFARSILLGAAAGLLYDLLRALRQRCPRLTGPLDAVYCAGLCCALFFFTLRRAQGILRGYVLLGALGGAVLFFALFSAPLRPIWDFWVETGAFFLRLLTIPIQSVKKIVKKIVKTGKKSLLFFPQMLYNKKYWNQIGFFEGRRPA